MSFWHISQAARTVRAGGVIAYPTEAVYGLGCVPWSYPAVQRILSLKHRKPEKGLIVVAARVEQIEFMVTLPDDSLWEPVLSSWPGPVTWVIPAREWVPDWLTGGRSSLAVRVSAHPLVQALCSKVGPLVSTSANPSDLAPARSSLRVRQYFGRSVDYVLPGQLGNLGSPTAIRDALSGQTLR